ncbi:MAG: A24 family peptidase C-terminal domain-containing protein [Candidatus Bathyarchaeia archaeon]
MWLLDLVRLGLPLVLLSYGSWSDLKTREVTNKVWVLGFPVGAALTVLSFALGEASGLLATALASIGLTTALALALFYLGLFGGADAKALIYISLSVPLHPYMPAGQSPLGFTLIFFPLSVFNNAVIFSLSIVPRILARNLPSVAAGKPVLKDVCVRSILGRAVLFATSYRTSLENLREKVYLYPAEVPVESEGSVSRRPRYFTNAELDKAELMPEIERRAATGLYNEGVLATPTIPMILFITLGFLAAIFFDLALIVAMTLLRAL